MDTARIIKDPGDLLAALMSRVDRLERTAPPIVVPGGGGGGFTVSETPPVAPAVGDGWYNPATSREFIYYDGFWVERRAAGDGPHQGPATSRPAAGSGVAGMVWYSTDTLTLSLCDGIGWVILDEPPQPWTTTFGANVVPGNGSHANNYYQRANGWCSFSDQFTLGTTSTVGATGANSTASLPTAPHDYAFTQFSVDYRDASAGQVFLGTVGALAQFQAMGLYYWISGASGIALQGPGISTAGPFAWAVNDGIFIAGRYRMATRYL